MKYKKKQIEFSDVLFLLNIINLIYLTVNILEFYPDFTGFNISKFLIGFYIAYLGLFLLNFHYLNSVDHPLHLHHYFG